MYVHMCILTYNVACTYAYTLACVCYSVWMPPYVFPSFSPCEPSLHLQDPGESFGMSIAGGLQSECGDLPVFITNVITDGPVGRTRKVKVHK